MPRDRCRRSRQKIKRTADFLGIGGAAGREADRPGGALEQPNSEIAFQLADRTAHRTMGHIQLVGGLGEAQQPGCRLEGAQRVERRKMADHAQLHL